MIIESPHPILIEWLHRDPTGDHVEDAALTLYLEEAAGSVPSLDAEQRLAWAIYNCLTHPGHDDLPTGGAVHAHEMPLAVPTEVYRHLGGIAERITVASQRIAEQTLAIERLRDGEIAALVTMQNEMTLALSTERDQLAALGHLLSSQLEWLEGQGRVWASSLHGFRGRAREVWKYAAWWAMAQTIAVVAILGFLIWRLR